MANPPDPSRRRWALIVASVTLALVALTSSACSSSASARPPGSSAQPVIPAGAHVVHPGATPADASTCGDPTASIPPPATLPGPGSMPAGSWMAHIKARGYLIAGVDQNTYLWGYRDPNSGQYSGFDIDMLREVSQAIFGTPGDIHFVAVPTGQRVQAVQKGLVDIVAETMTINCQRDQSVDFSSVYYQAGQEILVPSNSAITGPGDLGGKRICATDGSTSLDNLAALRLSPAPVLWAVPNDTDCLVMLQQGQVDAVSTDNVILQGLKAQDPNTTIVGPAFTQEPYGMAISKAHPEFTSFVNGVLAAERNDGTWATIYARSLGPYISGPTPAPPTATYRSVP